MLAVAAIRLRVFIVDENPTPRGRTLYKSTHVNSIKLVQQLTGMSAAQLSTEFESLGDNCELGLIQRRFGAEPLGLLRFSAAALPHVLRGIDTGFAKLGETLYTAMEGAAREWMVRDRDYDLRWHTHLHGEQATEASVLARETKKTAFLRQKLLRDISSSGKIFVVKSVGIQAEPEQIMALHLALNRSAANWLLWVTPADESHPVGLVEEIAPRLMHGRISRFARHGKSDDEDIDAWLAVLTNSWLCTREPVANRLPSLVAS